MYTLSTVPYVHNQLCELFLRDGFYKTCILADKNLHFFRGNENVSCFSQQQKYVMV